DERMALTAASGSSLPLLAVAFALLCQSGLRVGARKETAMSETVEMLRGWRRWTVAEKPNETLRKYLRHALTLVALLVTAFCARTGWYVLQDLQRIKLAELRHVPEVLTVGDVVLCLVGYSIGRELLRALLRRSS